MPKVIHFFKTVTTSVFLLGLVACFGGGGGTVRFYVLSSPGGRAEKSPPPLSRLRSIVGVGSVELPAYLDREGIVTRIDANSVHFSSLDEWAEPLQDGFTRVLLENLIALLPPDRFTVVPWRGPVSIDYRVDVKVFRFDGRLNGPVSLEVRWSIYRVDDGKELLTKDSNIEDSARGDGYGALIAAQSRTVVALSRQVAGAIKALPQIP